LAEITFFVEKLVKSITSEFPDIGRVVEEYVQERNVGADAWRRTGVLTAVKEKVTFSTSTVWNYKMDALPSAMQISQFGL
jgi:ADP-heptose:LPS heptosyltransferase